MFRGRVGILDANLIVAAVESCEMVPIFLIITQRFNAFSTRISNSQDQIAIVSLDLYHGCNKKGAIVRILSKLKRAFC